MRFGRSRSSKVIDFGTNRVRVCDFLLLHHSNVGPISCTVSAILQVMCWWPNPYSSLILECCRWTRSLMLGSARAQTFR